MSNPVIKKYQQEHALRLIESVAEDYAMELSEEIFLKPNGLEDLHTISFLLEKDLKLNHAGKAVRQILLYHDLVQLDVPTMLRQIEMNAWEQKEFAKRFIEQWKECIVFLQFGGIDYDV